MFTLKFNFRFPSGVIILRSYRLCKLAFRRLYKTNKDKIKLSTVPLFSSEKPGDSLCEINCIDYPVSYLRKTVATFFCARIIVTHLIDITTPHVANLSTAEQYYPILLG